MSDDHKELRERAGRWLAEHRAHFGKPLESYGLVNDLLAALDERQQEIDEQQKVLEKLPMTADGVRVFGGQAVWIPKSYKPKLYIHRQPGPVNGFVYWEDGFEPEQWYVKVSPLQGVHEGDSCIPVSECYSTREAAEAAREGT